MEIHVFEDSQRSREGQLSLLSVEWVWGGVRCGVEWGYLWGGLWTGSLSA